MSQEVKSKMEALARSGGSSELAAELANQSAELESESDQAERQLAEGQAELDALCEEMLSCSKSSILRVNFQPQIFLH